MTFTSRGLRSARAAPGASTAESHAARAATFLDERIAGPYPTAPGPGQLLGSFLPPSRNDPGQRAALPPVRVDFGVDAAMPRKSRDKNPLDLDLLGIRRHASA